MFVVTLEDFIQEHRNRELLKKINDTYVDGPDATEKNPAAQTA